MASGLMYGATGLYGLRCDVWWYRVVCFKI
jgi:hypothetical protein